MSAEVRTIAWKAQQRLHARLKKLSARGKPRNQAVAAVARELVGFIWAIALKEVILAWMPMQKKKPNKISHTHKDE